MSLTIDVPLAGRSQAGFHASPAVLLLGLSGAMQAHGPEGQSVLPRGRKARAILAVLALNAPRPVLREQLWRLLWSGRQPEQGRASLRQSLHELHMALQPLGEGVLQVGRTSVALSQDRVRSDLQDAARPASDAVGAGATGPEAGSFLADLVGLDPAFDRWREAEAQRLQRTARALAEAALLLQSDSAAQIVAAERLLAIEPSHEGAWRTLLEAHVRRGDRSAAIAAYQRCSAVLAESTGTMPSAETRDVLAQLRAPVPEGGPVAQEDRQGVRLGVVPFRAVEPRDEALSRGLADEITASLARFRWIAPVAVSPGPAETSGLERAGRETGDLDFLLDGALQRGRGRVRVAVRLLDMHAEGEVVWADRFDRRGADLLNVQDEIAAEIVAKVDPELLLREGSRAARHPAADPSAYHLLLKAIPAIYRLDRAGFRMAGEALAAAVARDPGYAAAYAWWACWHVFLVGQGWAEDAEAAMARAGELAERAVALDPADARALTIAGHVRGFLHRRLDEAMALHERALALNPNLPMAWVFSGLAHAYAGRHDEALRRIRTYQRLSRFDPHGFFFETALMVPHLFRGEYDRVVAIARRVTPLKPGFASTLRIHLAALGHLGRAEAAAEVRAHLLRLEPRFSIAETIARTPLARPQDRALYADGLRRAGLPE